LNKIFSISLLIAWSVTYGQTKLQFEPDYTKYSYENGRIRIFIKSKASKKEVETKFNYSVDQAMSNVRKKCTETEVKYNGTPGFELYFKPEILPRDSNTVIFFLKITDKKNPKNISGNVEITIPTKRLKAEDISSTNLSNADNNEDLPKSENQITNIKSQIDTSGSCLYLSFIFESEEKEMDTEWRVEQQLSPTANKMQSIQIQNINYNVKNKLVTVQIIPNKGATFKFNILNIKTGIKYSINATQYKNCDFNLFCSSGDGAAHTDVPKVLTFWQKYVIKLWVSTAILIALISSLVLYILYNRSKRRHLEMKSPEAIKDDGHAKVDSDIVFNENIAVAPFPLSSGRIPDGYKELSDLTKFYDDTRVSKIYISEQSAREIFEFVFKSVKTKPAPEVGGFLMGRVELNALDEEIYNLFIDKFIEDTEPNYQDTYTITFGSQISLSELEYLNKNPFAKKVGWLHTHPGHGIFLSEPDIKSHISSFPKPFQIAIVIETYDNYKTGIFSYKAINKEMNNLKDKKGADYITWKDLI